MTKRQDTTYAENHEDFNTGASDRKNMSPKDLKFIDECDAQIFRIANLAELFRVIDLQALRNREMDYHEPVTFALREFGAVLSGIASEAMDTLQKGKNSLGLRD